MLQVKFFLLPFFRSRNCNFSQNNNNGFNNCVLELFIYYRALCFGTVHVLQGLVFWNCSCITGPCVLELFMYYRALCFGTVHVLQGLVFWNCSCITGPCVFKHGHPTSQYNITILQINTLQNIPNTGN